MSKVNLAQLGLQIDSPLSVPSAANFRPLNWPPAHDWPVVFNEKGEIVCRWGCPVWPLYPWAKQALSLNFGDGPINHGDSIDPANANLLRQITGWWIWGPNGVQAAGTLYNKFTLIRQVFVMCSKEGILASDLMRFPAVADRLPGVLAPSRAAGVIAILHDLYDQRDKFGFILLDRTGLSRLEAAIPDHESKQTPYIPPRIWTYQVTRLRSCLDDFLAHREQVEACYRFCLDVYSTNYGSLAKALTVEPINSRVPFQTPSNKNAGAKSGAKFHGPFKQTAKRFGIDELLARWVGAPSEGDSAKGIRLLSAYMSLISLTGLAYLLNYSLMRIEEAWDLRQDCLDIERDEKFGDIYLLHGVTTKTMDDSNARWPTSPSVKVAIEAMTCITRLRLICAEAHPDINLTQEDIDNPYLINKVFAPWTSRNLKKRELRPFYGGYADSLTAVYPLLFDVDTLRITEQDLQLARYITPTLDPERFAVGKPWPFAWHQLRRTGAVNMQASGLVSDATLQLLLKHVTRTMTLYYGQNHTRLKLNNDARTQYVRTMYEVLGKELARLTTERFVSPHGDRRKTEIVRLITQKDAKALTAAAKRGAIACREIILGYCMNREPCAYGGIDSIAHCGGGDGSAPCPDVLYDKRNIEMIRKLDKTLDERLINAPTDSPLRNSLQAQKRSVRNFLDVAS